MAKTNRSFGPLTPATRPGLVRVLGLAIVLALAAWLTTGPVSGQGTARATPDPVSDALVPDPVLTPGEVVRIQLEALRHNDGQDRGIAVTFRFASPANRANTGPFPRFAAMIKNGPYALMLDFREARYGPVEIVAKLARQRVTLTGAGGRMTYWFYLSRQVTPPYVDCWMTDAVYIERSDERTV